jgi:hypothetical protein
MTQTAIKNFVYDSSFTIDVDSEGVDYRQNGMPAFLFIPRGIRALFRDPELDKLGLGLNEVINKIYEFLGNDNIDLNSEARGVDSFVEIIDYDRKYEKVSEDKRSGYLSSFSSNPWERADRYYSYCRFSYAQKNPRIALDDDFANVLSMVLDKKVPTKNISLDSFNTLLDEAALAMDNLFIQQGIEPSSDKRGNLISLLLGISSYLLIDEDVRNILKVERPGEHNIFNTNIVRLAGDGLDNSVLKLFYVHQYYPTTEQLKDLVSVPYSMLSGIIGAR